MDSGTILFLLFECALLAVGCVAIVFRCAKFLINRKKTSPAPLRPRNAWEPRRRDFFVFLGTIFCVLIIVPVIGCKVASTFYPEIDCAQEPLYYIGFSQAIALAGTLLLLKFYKSAFPPRFDLPASENVPAKQSRAGAWLSLYRQENVWKLFCMALAATFFAGMLSTIVPKIVPALESYWEKNQILVENLHALKDGSVLFFAVPAIVIFTPIIEELFFRAGIYRFFKGKMSSMPAAILTGIIFAALHDSFAGFLPLIALNCALCYAYERTGTLAVPIVIHALFNANSLLAIACDVEM